VHQNTKGGVKNTGKTNCAFKHTT